MTVNAIKRFLARMFGRLDIRGPGDPNPENDLARRAMYPPPVAKEELEARRRALEKANQPPKKP